MKSFQTLVVLLKKKDLLFHLNSMLFLFLKTYWKQSRNWCLFASFIWHYSFLCPLCYKNVLRQNVLLAFQLNLCFWANAISKQRIVFLNDANNQLIRDLLLVQMRQLLGNDGKISTNHWALISQSDEISTNQWALVSQSD